MASCLWPSAGVLGRTAWTSTQGPPQELCRNTGLGGLIMNQGSLQKVLPSPCFNLSSYCLSKILNRKEKKRRNREEDQSVKIPADPATHRLTTWPPHGRLSGETLPCLPPPLHTQLGFFSWSRDTGSHSRPSSPSTWQQLGQELPRHRRSQPGLPASGSQRKGDQLVTALCTSPPFLRASYRIASFLV